MLQVYRQLQWLTVLTVTTAKSPCMAESTSSQMTVPTASPVTTACSLTHVMSARSWLAMMQGWGIHFYKIRHAITYLMHNNSDNWTTKEYYNIKACTLMFLVTFIFCNTHTGMNPKYDLRFSTENSVKAHQRSPLISFKQFIFFTMFWHGLGWLKQKLCHVNDP